MYVFRSFCAIPFDTILLFHIPFLEDWKTSLLNSASKPPTSKFNARTTKVAKVINLQFPVEILYTYNSMFLDIRLTFDKIF